MVRDEQVSFSLELNVQPALIELRKYETVLYRSLGLAQRLGATSVAEIRQKIALLNQMRLALLAIQAARMAAGDPMAWLMAGVAVAEVAVEVGSQLTQENAGAEGPQ